MHRIGRTGRVGRTGRAITFVTPSQRKEIGRIERDAKTSHRRVGVPRGAARARPAAAPQGAQAARARRTAEAEPRRARRARRRRRRRHDEALRQPRRAQRDHRRGPALGAHGGRGRPRGRDRGRPRPAPLLIRRDRPRARRAGGRAPRRHEGQGAGDPPRSRPQLGGARSPRHQLGDPAEQVGRSRSACRCSRWRLGPPARRASPPRGRRRSGSGSGCAGAQLAQDVEARLPRHHRVEQDQVGRLSGAAAPQLLDGLLAVGGGDRPRSPPSPAASASAAGSSPSRRRPGSWSSALPSLATARPRSRGRRRRGRTMRKLRPRPRSESTPIAPPCSSTSDLEIARPRPVPPTRWVRPASPRVKRSKMWSTLALGDPGPSSETASSTPSADRARR